MRMVYVCMMVWEHEDMAVWSADLCPCNVVQYNNRGERGNDRGRGGAVGEHLALT